MDSPLSHREKGKIKQKVLAVSISAKLSLQLYSFQCYSFILLQLYSVIMFIIRTLQGSHLVRKLQYCMEKTPKILRGLKTKAKSREELF